MRNDLLQYLRCPQCRGILHINETHIPLLHLDNQEIQEGHLRCVDCASFYPIIAGVALLVVNPLTYIANNYSAIFYFASPFLSSALKMYLQQPLFEVQGMEHTSIGSIQRNLSRYICTQYDSSALLSAPENPLYHVMSGENWYRQLIRFAEPYLQKKGMALDIGCNVGGHAIHLTSSYEVVFGLDVSFPAILTARRIAQGFPEPQRSYHLHQEANIFQERPLLVETPRNIEFLVASASALPFELATFATIVCSNLLDVLPSPRQLLKNVSALLQDEGIYLMASPYTWIIGQTPLEEWNGGQKEIASVDAIRELVGSFFTILSERDHVPWTLRIYERLFHIYLTHQLIARKEQNHVRKQEKLAE